MRRWRWVGLCSLFCVASPWIAAADVNTPTPPKKAAHVASSPATKSKHPAAGQTSAKRSSTHSSAHSSAHPATRKPAARSTSASSQKSKNSRGRKGAKPVAKKHGQQAIDADRTREIQSALIREHYLDGEPSGTWDGSTQAAMQRYQADQGWQSKTTPDARALIKLGLGPSHDHLLNPESAMTTPSAPAPADPKAPAKTSPPESNIPQ